MSKLGGKNKARGVDVEIVGLKDVMRNLRRLPDKAATNSVAKAARFSMTPVKKEAQKNAPRGKGLKPSGRTRPHLWQTMKIKRKVYKASGVVAVIVGHEARQSPHAHLVHDGTRRHFISPTGGATGVLKIGRSFIRRPVRHPGARANPYLVDALESKEASVRSRFASKLKKEMTKEVIKLAKSQARV